jgi:hypothetical protein
MRRHPVRDPVRALATVLLAVALTLVGFGHAPVAAVPDLAAYAAPDGSMPDICGAGLASERGEKAVHDRCDACTLVAGAALPPPFAGAPVLRTHPAAHPPTGPPALVHGRRWRPNLSRSPPVLSA